MVLLFTTIVQGYFTWYLWQANKYANVSKIEYLTHQALDGLYNLGASQVVTDKEAVHIPTAKITFPISESILGLSAIYSGDPDKLNQADMTITYSTPFAYGKGQLYNTAGIDELFTKVPIAQACTRQMTILFNYENDLGEEYKKAFTKTLQDGRAVTGYISTKCTMGSEELSNYVSQMQSY